MIPKNELERRAYAFAKLLTGENLLPLRDLDWHNTAVRVTLGGPLDRTTRRPFLLLRWLTDAAAARRELALQGVLDDPRRREAAEAFISRVAHGYPKLNPEADHAPSA